MADSIRLRRYDGIWHATSEGPGAQRIRELFGTVTIPTPFMATVPASTVLAEIQRRNPDVEVTIE